MVIIWGNRLYGTVDRVPGICYVATRFFHLYYIPLIPLGSWVVLEGSETDDGWRGTKIGLSLKSVFIGWLRTAAWIFGLVELVSGFIAWRNHDPEAWRPLTLGVVSLVAFGMAMAIRKASAHRALELAEKLGLPPEIATHLETLYQMPGLAEQYAARQTRDEV